MREFERQIPKWIKQVTDGDPEMWLIRNNKNALNAASAVYEASRINPSDFLVFYLSIVAMEQVEKNNFYEKAIAELTHDIISLRERIKMLENKKGDLP